MHMENYHNAHGKINRNYPQYCLRLLTLNDKEI